MVAFFHSVFVIIMTIAGNGVIIGTLLFGATLTDFFYINKATSMIFLMIFQDISFFSQKLHIFLSVIA